MSTIGDRTLIPATDSSTATVILCSLHANLVADLVTFFKHLKSLLEGTMYYPAWKAAWMLGQTPKIVW